MNESILPGMRYYLGKRAGKSKIERNIISIEPQLISVNGRGMPIDPNIMPIYEIRISIDKIGNPYHRRLIANESDDSWEAIRIMESLDVCYTIIWQVGEKEILFEGNIQKPVPSIPLPSLYLLNNRWLLGLEGIEYYIKLIEVVTPDILSLRSMSDKARKVFKKREVRRAATLFEHGLMEAGWIVDL